MQTLIDLSDDYGCIGVSGSNATTFLQGQLSCQVNNLPSNQYRLGAYCTPQGKIKALIQLFPYQGNFVLLLPLGLLPVILNALNKVARFSKVTVNDLSHSLSRFGLITQYPNIEKPEFPTSFQLFSLPSYCCPLLIGPQTETLQIQNVQNDINAWALKRIQAGIPEVYLETFETFLPHYLNLPALDAVSFDKGCYCGQEIIARMHYRGNLKRHLYRAVLEKTTPLPPGTKFYTREKQSVGTLVCSAEDQGVLTTLIELQDNFSKTNELYVYTQEELQQIPLISLLKIEENSLH